MKKTAEEILNETSPTRPWPEGGKTDAMIIKCMKIYADQFKQKWIPVSEKLPAPNVRIRAIRTYGNGKMEEVHTYWFERTECFDDFLTDIITHWQYIDLPSAPERKEVVG